MKVCLHSWQPRYVLAYPMFQCSQPTCGEWTHNLVCFDGEGFECVCGLADIQAWERQFKGATA